MKDLMLAFYAHAFFRRIGLTLLIVLSGVRSFGGGDVWVFGSPQSILAGQELDEGLATRPLSERRGATEGVPEGVAPWRLAGVREDRVILRYSNGEPPEVQERTVITNLTPAYLDEVFLRRVTGVSDNPNLSLLILYTEEVGLAELVADYTFEIDVDAAVFGVDPRGRVMEQVFAGAAVVSSPVTFSVENLVLQDDAEARFEVISASWTFEPAVELNFSISGNTLNHFSVAAQGPLAVDYDMSLQVHGGVREWGGHRFPIRDAVGGSLAYLGSIGEIPLWAAQRSRLVVESRHLRNYNTAVRGGMAEELNLSWSATYQPEADLKVFWQRNFVSGQPQRAAETQFEVTEGHRVGRARGYLFLHPQFEVEVVGVGTVQVDPRPELNFRNFPNTEAPFKDEPIKELEARLALYGRMTLSGSATEDRRLNWLSPYEITLLPLADPADRTGALRWHRQPTHAAAVVGHPLILNAYATAGGEDVNYQWFKGGAVLPGQNRSRLVIPEADFADAGEYTVQVSSGIETASSDTAVVKISPFGLGDPAADAPEGFVYIPAGSFRMGSDMESFPYQYLFAYKGSSAYRPFWVYGTLADISHAYWEENYQNASEEDLEWSYLDLALNYPGDGRNIERISAELLNHRDFLISPMYVQSTAMPYDRMMEIWNWGVEHGYTFGPISFLFPPGPGYPASRWPGEGVTPATNNNHPADSINWFDAVKTANALSEKEGREPVYSIRRAGGAPEVWRTGGFNKGATNSDIIIIDFSKNGYRLPNYAEYQYFVAAGTTTDFWAGNMSWGPEYFGTGGDWGAIAEKADPVLVEIANYHGSWIDNPDVGGMSMKVDSLRVNPFGLHHAMGNSREWLNDAVNVDYRRWQTTQTVDPLVRDNWFNWVNHYDPSRSAFMSSNYTTPHRMLGGRGLSWSFLNRSATGSLAHLPTANPEKGFRLILNIPRD
jgi:formylglycine-generating enzyme required for sulfatase activity